MRSDSPESGAARIIANLASNHLGDVAVAERMIREAADIGCDAICLPLGDPVAGFTRESLAAGRRGTKGDATDPRVVPPLPLASLGDLKHACGDLELILAPQDLPSLEACSGLAPGVVQVDAHLIGHRRFLEHAAVLGCPLVVVAAMVDESELLEGLEILGDSVTTVLHSVAAEVASLEGARLGLIGRLRNVTGVPVGYWGQERDPFGLAVARALGAMTLERSFSLDHRPTFDGRTVSLGREDFRSSVDLVRQLEASIRAPGRRDILVEEMPAVRDFQVGLVAAHALKAGDPIRPDSVAAKAPRRGISPGLVDSIVGRRVLYDLEPDDPITFGAIEP